MPVLTLLIFGLIFKVKSSKGGTQKMNNNTKSYELIYVILNFGMGSRVYKYARELGIKEE